METRSDIEEDVCPLCEGTAETTLPEWSGGRLQVRCADCGNFETNYPSIDVFRELGESRQMNLYWIRDQIRRSPKMVHVTKNIHGAITVEYAEPMTKFQKKHRRKSIKNSSGVSSSETIYFAGPMKTNPYETRDD